MLIDGHPQYMGLFGHPISDAYQSLMAERVEVLRGPASVLYGSNAMGGVVNIVTRKMREDGVKNYLHTGYGSYNTLQSELTNRIRKGRFTGVVSGSYNRTDGHRANMGFEQYGGYAKLGYEISNHWNAWADMNVTHFNASNPGETFDPLIDNDQRITRGMTSLALENRYAKTSGTLSFFYNWGKHWINDGYHPDEQPLDYRFRSRDDMLGLSWYQSVRLFEGNRLTVGVDYFRFGGEAWNQPVGGGDREMQADKIQHETAGYVDFRQSLTRWLTFDAGLRLDHHSHVGTEWVPQAGLSFVLPRRAAAQIFGGQRIPLSHHPRVVYVSSGQSRPEARAAVELRAFFLPATVRRTSLLRGQRLSYRRREPDRADAGRRTPHERQYRADPECGRRVRGFLPRFEVVVARCQLQLSAHAAARAGFARTQALCRGDVLEGAVECFVGRSIRCRSLYRSKAR